MVKELMVVGGFAVLAMGAWRVGDSLSSDALSMAVGILFGILAGLPTALLVLASNRRREDEPSIPDRETQRRLLRIEQKLDALTQPPALPQPATRFQVVEGKGFDGSPKRIASR